MTSRLVLSVSKEHGVERGPEKCERAVGGRLLTDRVSRRACYRSAKAPLTITIRYLLAHDPMKAPRVCTGLRS